MASTSWDTGFAEETRRVLREKVAPAVRRIERAVEDNRSMRGLSLRFGPPAAPAAFALLATGAYTGAAAHRLKRKETTGDRLYFYYRAGALLGGSKRRTRRGRS